MPTLEITDHEVIEITEMMILECMLYPSDEVARRHWVLRSIIRFLQTKNRPLGRISMIIFTHDIIMVGRLCFEK